MKTLLERGGKVLDKERSVHLLSTAKKYQSKSEAEEQFLKTGKEDEIKKEQNSLDL